MKKNETRIASRIIQEILESFIILSTTLIILKSQLKFMEIIIHFMQLYFSYFFLCTPFTLSFDISLKKTSCLQKCEIFARILKKNILGLNLTIVTLNFSNFRIKFT